MNVIMDIIILSLCAIILTIAFVMLVLSCISKFSSSIWFCNKMGWHKNPISKGFDGCSSTGVCPRCKKNVLLDSQGNWF